MDPFSSGTIARQTWELENNIVTTTDSADSSSAASDAIFYYDEAAQTKFQQEKPWATDPHYFKRVKISALALLKMVVHARSGGTIEVMGLMQGKTDGDAIIVMDAFALPVEGTETRVNAQADAYEYMVDYSQTNKQVFFILCSVMRLISLCWLIWPHMSYSDGILNWFSNYLDGVFLMSSFREDVFRERVLDWSVVDNGSNNQGIGWAGLPW